jgi:hypothetical protein
METVVNNKFSKPNKFRLDWLFPITIRPKKTFQAIFGDETPVWAAPMLLVSILLLVVTMISTSMGMKQIMNNPPMPMPGDGPMEMDVYSGASMPVMEGEMYASSMPAGGAISGIAGLFGGLGKVVGLWITWLITGSALHMGLMVAGSRSTNKAAMNLSAWAMIPVGVRAVIQSVYMLITQQPINGEGLSGLVSGKGSGSFFIVALLALIDIYWLWHVFLLIFGGMEMTHLNFKKVLIVVLIVSLLLLVLRALPPFISMQLGSMFTGGGMGF